MAEYAGRIRVKAEVETSEANKQLSSLSKGMANAGNEAGTMSKNLLGSFAGLAAKIGAVVAAVAGLKKVISISDELSGTQARIAQMNDGLQTTDEIMSMIYQAAQNSRGTFGDMADVVARFGNNARDAFNSAEEVVQFSELVQKQMVIAGAGAQEASNAMLQLSQALGSGVLRGDELNSIFEQAPNLIRTIADYLGVSVGEIRSMAAEGKITADVVKKAMLAAADDINEKFDAMPKTWSQSMTSFKNGALMAFKPVLDSLNRLANSEAFKRLEQLAISAISTIASGISMLIDLIAQLDQGNILGLQYNGSTAKAAADAAAYGKALDQTAESAKKAAGALASFDDIEVLKIDSGDDVKDTLPDLAAAEAEVKKTGEAAKKATGAINPIIKKAKEAFHVVADEVKDRYGEIAKATGETIKNLKDDLIYLWNGVSDPLSEQKEVWLGIFKAFGFGVIDLLSRTVRDLLQLIFDPIHRNIAGISEAVQGEVDRITVILEGIKTVVEDVMTHAVDVYDQHVKPFIDDLTDGVSTLLGIVLKGWNEEVSPLMDDAAKKVQDVLEGKVSPALQSTQDAFGSIVDAVHELWRLLEPLIDWLAENVVPLFGKILVAKIEVLTAAFGLLFDIIKAVADIVSIAADKMAFMLGNAADLVRGKAGMIFGWSSVNDSGYGGGTGKTFDVPSYAKTANGNPDGSGIMAVGTSEAVVDTEGIKLAVKEGIEEADIKATTPGISINGRELARSTYSDYQSESRRLHSGKGQDLAFSF